jgi:hypothetical protein
MDIDVALAAGGQNAFLQNWHSVDTVETSFLHSGQGIIAMSSVSCSLSYMYCGRLHSVAARALECGIRRPGRLKSIALHQGENMGVAMQHHSAVRQGTGGGNKCETTDQDLDVNTPQVSLHMK